MEYKRSTRLCRCLLYTSKINKIDIVGFLFKKGNLNKDEIGRIDVKAHYSFAAVSRKKIKQTLNVIRNEKIKGIKTLIEEAK